jgi:GNAT superfamily N-acetyltransferase
MGAVAPDLAAPRAIRPDDDASQFSCGDEVKDQWIRKYAVANHFGGGAKVYVAVSGTRIVGFYALATASIQHSDATPRVSKSMPDPVPAILLGRLAADSKEAGKGLGSFLLRDAIIRTLAAAEVVGVRVLLVHAASEAARKFYADRGFEPSPTDPLQLMIMLKDATAILARGA